ncbi:MAG TPA: beta-L-arabinofuranosidase domain-containing protein [Terracidiphilus sp.]|nr:beta-L-arabinofuranosidase domain-containing protein [Terracidiphilus sp.]
MRKRFTRRFFLSRSAAMALAGAVRLPGFAQPFESEKGSTQLSQFRYADVELLAGPMLDQFRANHRFFLALDEDAVLKPFRQRAGLPAPGPDMGGWYSWSKEFDPPNNMTGYIPGHTFGQYLSGLARAYAATGDKPTQAKIHRLVRGYAETITTNFYKGYPLPCYTFDKINCGLIDAHQFAHDPDAMPALARATDAVMPWLPPQALTRPEMAARPHPNIAYTWDESYTLPENLFLAWKRSGDRRYLTLAQRFLQDKDYFDPLAAGQNALPHQHAYSHVNALSSASQAYLVLGSQKHLRAARNGFGFLLAQSFATGGWGPNETFVEPGSGGLGESLATTHASFETPCGSYGHFKIVRYLMRITGDSRYGDSMERVLYNCILGAEPIQPSGFSFYYSDYNNHGAKVYYPEQWPCCSGTFPQVTADYGISSYFQSPEGIFVNLFVPSRLRFQRNGTQCSIEQQTRYPYVGETTLRLTSERPEKFTLALRVPEWAGTDTSVSVNGQRWSGGLHPGSFLRISREWKSGDTIEYSIGMTRRLEAVDAQHPNTVALLFGPLTLFALNSPGSRFTRPQLLAAELKDRSWIANSAAAPVSFKAFPDVRHEEYRLYHEVSA